MVFALSFIWLTNKMVDIMVSQQRGGGWLHLTGRCVLTHGKAWAVSKGRRPQEMENNCSSLETSAVWNAGRGCCLRMEDTWRMFCKWLLGILQKIFFFFWCLAALRVSLWSYHEGSLAVYYAISYRNGFWEFKTWKNVRLVADSTAVKVSDVRSWTAGERAAK